MAVDTLLNNRYAINETGVDPIGKGGMAAIYAGTDTESGQTIAAKTLLSEYQGDTHRRSRFRREGDVLKAVQHEHIVELIEVIDGRRGSWIIMEHLTGETLRDKLDAEGPFRPSTVNEWLKQVCAALDAIHAAGFVHLDITPQNLFLTDRGSVKLIDFGIAQKAYVQPMREGNKLLGTAAYISPEHGSGQIVTPASDLYSLGCVVFELLTGKKVFSEHGHIGNDATVAMRQNNVPDLPTSVAPDLHLPVWVDTVVAKALLPHPEERYPSASAFSEEFDLHANPPFIRLSWPRRRKVQQQAHVPAATEDVAPSPVYSPAEETEHYQRKPGRVGSWARKELRNARRAIVMFALLISIVFAVPLLGGSVAMDWALGLVPGSDTTVVDGNWYMRAGPATESEVRTLLMQGESVEITGAPVVNGSDMWWPVRADVDGVSYHGWAHDNGLQRTWIMDRAAGLQLTRADISNGWDSVTGLLPG